MFEQKRSKIIELIEGWAKPDLNWVCYAYDGLVRGETHLGEFDRARKELEVGRDYYAKMEAEGQRSVTLPAQFVRCDLEIIKASGTTDRQYIEKDAAYRSREAREHGYVRIALTVDNLSRKLLDPGAFHKTVTGKP